jgi:Cu2+-exporting ATPase
VSRLAAHRSVRSARWTAVTRSLLVEFEPAREFTDVAAELPATDGAPPAPESPPSQPAWRQFLVPAISLLAGVSGAGLLARICIALCGLPVAGRAMRALLRREVTIDVLDLIAVTLLLLTGDALAAGVSVCLIETGERIRRRATGRARRVLRGWLGANPRGIRVLRGGSEPRVPGASVEIGDHVVVYPGETVPVDGVVSAGLGLVDTRSWTGESLPRDVGPGTAILAGSGLADGRVVIEVTAAGEDTRAGRLAAALEEALAADTRVSDMARRIADRFVLPVLAASGLIFVLTRNVSSVVAMLIFDYGTGVRIGIPTTVLTTMVAGARRRVLFKSGHAVEELGRVDTIVFDKTGTLTSGVLAVVAVEAVDGVDADHALRLAAAAEGHLPHPIARAIRRAARSRRLELPEPEWVRYRPGGGVEARVDGRDVLVGDRRLLEEVAVDLPLSPRPESLTVFVAADGRCLGRVRFRDRIKDSARQVVVDLRRAGVERFWLASGDHHAAASAVCRQLGLDGYHARMMPEAKAALVRRMVGEGRRVAVVGDGINDAPAMAEAHVSVAVPRGADLARETADVVLLSEDLRDLVTAIDLSRSGMRIIRQNIGVVAVPNTVGMLLAGTSRISPLLATLLNNGSTLLAAGNGLRPLLAARDADRSAQSSERARASR